jgi:hypothetical protein
MPMNKSCAVVCALAFCQPFTVTAQDYSAPVMVTPWDMGTTSTTIIDNIVSQQLNEDIVEKSIPDTPPDGGRPSKSEGWDFAYGYSAARTQQNLRSFIARTPDPAARASLEQLFAAQPGLMNDISAAVRAYGFDPHNVADAYAVWWINVWGTSQKRNIEPDPATVEAVKRQVRGAFGATPDFAKASDAERQEYAEALLLQATMLGLAFEQGKDDPEMLEQLAQSARQGAMASGLDLAKMTLTPAGFVPRK